MCEGLATTREHVPPICLFPEKKEISVDLRKELLTVPSCDEHNSSKSKDDEYLMIAIAGILNNNLVGTFHHFTKVKRALLRKSKNFLTDMVLKGGRVHEHKSASGRTLSVISGAGNTERLKKCFMHIALGLFFHEFKYRFEGTCEIMLGFLRYENEVANDLIRFIKDRFNAEENDQNILGANPEVFTYIFLHPDSAGLIGLKMRFYQGAEIFVSFIPEGKSVEFDLGMNLIFGGFPTTYIIDEKEYKFNTNR